jgi:hypothetical protein
MPRRADIQPRTLDADPVYGSQLVTQIVNCVMLDGKKSIAEGVVYKALERVGERTGRPPVEVLEDGSMRPLSIEADSAEKQSESHAIFYKVMYFPQANLNQGFRKFTVEIISDVGKQYRVRYRPGYRPHLAN